MLLDVSAGEWTRVGYDLQTGALFVDQSHTNANRPDLSDAYQTSASLSHVTAGGGAAVVDTLNLTVLVDGGMLESFANDRVVITSLLSPSDANGTSDADTRQVRAFVYHHHSTVDSDSSSKGSKSSKSSSSSKGAHALECRATASKLQSISPQWLMRKHNNR